MKIRSITLCNFKSFRGKYVIDLSTDYENHKNIVLIGGANGAGKTTILEAVRLCMFGKRFNGNTLTNKDYEEYVLSARNTSSVKENNSHYFIELDIEVSDAYSPYSITLKREFRTANEKLMKENFTILRDGTALEIVPRECWEDYVVSLFPPYIMEYFFFDGERIEELATGDNAERALREAIRDLVGLKLYETLSMDIDLLMRKIRRRSIDIPEFKEKILEKDKEILEIEKEMAETEQKIKMKNQEILELNDRRDFTEANLRRRAGSIAKERERYEENLFELNEELMKLEDEIREMCGEVLPFVIASGVREGLLRQLRKERNLKELTASQNVLKEVNQKLIERIRSSEILSLPREHLENVERVVEDTFLEIIGELGDEPGAVIHDLPGAQMDRIEYFLSNVEERVREDMQKILERREEILLQSKRVREGLKRISDEAFVREFIDQLSSIQRDVKILEREIESLQDSQKVLMKRKNEENAERTGLEDEIICMYEEKKKIEVCRKVKDVISDFIDTSIVLRIVELQETITKLYRELSNKEDMVKRIGIDSDGLTATLVGLGGEIVNKENISAGEKEIFALSVLWGLSKISCKKFPLIVDSLLARLDKTHADNIVEAFFPKAGEQVIVLAHDREIDEWLHDKMKTYISKEYTLLLNDSKKVVEGYLR